MELHNASVLEFIRDLGSSAPAPGGGSVAAMNGATAAALIEMVANLTIGSAKYEAVHEEMKSIQQKMCEVKEEFVYYINKDSEAFMELMAAYKLPKETEEEKAFRKEEIERTTQQAALVPYEIGKLAISLLPVAERVIERGNANVVTDGLIAMLNACAATKSAFLNVKVNMKYISTPVYRGVLQNNIEELECDIRDGEERYVELAKLHGLS